MKEFKMIISNALIKLMLIILIFQTNNYQIYIVKIIY
jgi:hypothetical protein